MKKRLLILPLLGGFLLTGCDFMDTVKGWFSPKTEDKSSGDSKKDKGDDDDIPELIVDHTPQIKETYGGYKLARTLQEGKRYILGAYRHKSDTMRFFNGDYHRDGNGPDDYYPYYLGTVENSTESAAQIEIEFVDGSTTDFNIHVVEIPGEGEKPYLDKYIGIYAGTSEFDNVVTSMALLDDPNQTTYHDPKKDVDHEGVKCNFTFTGKYTKGEGASATEVDVYAPCIWFSKNDEPEQLIFLGTKIDSNNYTSFDSQYAESATDGGAYDLAHFYELIEE